LPTPNNIEPAVKPDVTEPVPQAGAVEPVVEPNVAAAPPEPNAPAPIAEPNLVAPAAEPNVVPPHAEPNAAEPNGPKSPAEVRFHDKYAGILGGFVNNKGLVDYQTLKRYCLELKTLLDHFAGLDPNAYNLWPKQDKIACWINAYNIRMLKVIVDNYPIQSSRLGRLFWWPPSDIRYINKDIGGIEKQKMMVMNEEFTLAAVEKRLFQRDFDEPRVFFALCRATLDSPPLRSEPYCGRKLQEQLDDQARKFLSSPHAFRIDRATKEVRLSALLQPNEYGKEFVNKYNTDKKFKEQPPAIRAILNFITRYISEQDKSFLETELYSIKYLKYDWRLNDSSTPQQ